MKHIQPARHTLRELFASALVALMLAACSGGAPPVAPTLTPATGATGSPVLPVETPTATPATGATSSPVLPIQTPTATPATPTQQATQGVTTPVGGGASPVFKGGLAAAIPRLVAGEPVKVVGPMKQSDAPGNNFNLGEVQQLLDTLGVDVATIEIAMGTNNDLIITAIRIPGVDSATLDQTYMAVLAKNTGYGGFRVVSTAGRNVHAWDTFYGTQYAWVNGDILFSVLALATPDVALQAIGAMPGSSVALVPGGTGVDSKASIDLTIAGGPNAGAYHAEVTEGGCSRNALGQNQLGFQYSIFDGTVEFSSLQLIVSNAQAATTTGGTNDFMVIFTVLGTEYDLEPKSGSGSGTVQAELSADGPVKAIFRIKGATTDNVQLSATVQCALLVDFSK